MTKKLISIAEANNTPLGQVSPWTIYRLIRDGQLKCVRIGRRVFLTDDGIAEFVARGGEVAA